MAGEVTPAVGDDLFPPSWPLTDVLGETLALTTQWQSGAGIRRTRAGVAAARTRGQLRGRPPKLTDYQERYIVDLYWTDCYAVSDIGELLDVSRSTVYRAAQTPTSAAAGATSGQVSSRTTR